MRIIIVKPRLDVSFKPGPVPNTKGPVPAIRVHWENFVNKVFQKHIDEGHEVHINEMPLWHLTNEVALHCSQNCDILYIPHRQSFEYRELSPNCQIFYYMQTHHPEFFTVDSNGWGAYLSYLPFDLDDVIPDMNLWNRLKSRIHSNISKFDQPNQNPEGLHWKDYWLFICQIPHDQVIIQSSEVSVADALRKTIKLARQRGQKVLVKSHPANPGAMDEFYKISMENKDITWYPQNISIHTAIENSSAVFCVNSGGGGHESIIHEKPIVTFGNSEYSQVVNSYNGELTTINTSVINYQKYMTAYYSRLFYTGDDSEWQISQI